MQKSNNSLWWNKISQELRADPVQSLFHSTRIKIKRTTHAPPPPPVARGWLDQIPSTENPQNWKPSFLSKATMLADQSWDRFGIKGGSEVVLMGPTLPRTKVCGGGGGGEKLAGLETSEGKEKIWVLKLNFEIFMVICH
ncbi:hypothetical protein L3X38_015351 [Prunus dulcis]|uniref:Uncharacterized protein n=1 Tax=Prunus dulcis TaxID=3755 RepID=A0AAD4WS14_PRUDU|nr:hypothetical protein L3X38_015351 [Prunus dulcis]